MYKDGDEIHETATEAREGVNVKGMTTVLFGSIGLVCLLFFAVWYFWMH